MNITNGEDFVKSPIHVEYAQLTDFDADEDAAILED